MAKGCIIHLHFPVWPSIFHGTLCLGAAPQPSLTKQLTCQPLTRRLTQRLRQLVRQPELCFKWHRHCFWDAYTLNSIRSNRDALSITQIFQTHSPNMKWAGKEIATNHNRSCSRIATIIPCCRNTPTPTSHTEDRYSGCFHVFIIWKTVKTFKMQMQMEAECAWQIRVYCKNWAYFIPACFVFLSYHHGRKLFGVMAS